MNSKIIEYLQDKSRQKQNPSNSRASAMTYLVSNSKVQSHCKDNGYGANTYIENASPNTKRKFSKLKQKVGLKTQVKEGDPLIKKPKQEKKL